MFLLFFYVTIVNVLATVSSSEWILSFSTKLIFSRSLTLSNRTLSTVCQNVLLSVIYFSLKDRKNIALFLLRNIETQNLFDFSKKMFTLVKILLCSLLLCIRAFLFYLGFLSRTFTIHRTACEGGRLFLWLLSITSTRFTVGWLLQSAHLCT